MGAAHNHAPGGLDKQESREFRNQLWIAFSITALIAIAQAIGSALTGSLALLTDTVHALTDASGLLVAVIAATLMVKPATPTRTWGFRRIAVIEIGRAHVCT